MDNIQDLKTTCELTRSFKDLLKNMRDSLKELKDYVGEKSRKLLEDVQVSIEEIQALTKQEKRRFCEKIIIASTALACLATVTMYNTSPSDIAKQVQQNMNNPTTHVQITESQQNKYKEYFNQRGIFLDGSYNRATVKNKVDTNNIELEKTNTKEMRVDYSDDVVDSMGKIDNGVDLLKFFVDQMDRFEDNGQLIHALAEKIKQLRDRKKAIEQKNKEKSVDFKTAGTNQVDEIISADMRARSAFIAELDPDLVSNEEHEEDIDGDNLMDLVILFKGLVPEKDFEVMISDIEKYRSRNNSQFSKEEIDEIKADAEDYSR